MKRRIYRTHLLGECDSLSEHGQGVQVHVQQGQRVEAQVAADGLVVRVVLGTHQRHGSTGLVGTRGTTGAMDVHLRGAGHVVVDDGLDLGDIQTTSSHVRRNCKRIHRQTRTQHFK